MRQNEYQRRAMAARALAEVSAGSNSPLFLDGQCRRGCGVDAVALVTGRVIGRRG